MGKLLFPCLQRLFVSFLSCFVLKIVWVINKQDKRERKLLYFLILLFSRAVLSISDQCVPIGAFSLCPAELALPP